MDPMQESLEARATAKRIARGFTRKLGGYSPRSEVGTVVDTSFQVSHGYVTCTASRGPVIVTGVPYNSVIPGMRIYMRKLSFQGQTSYIYDGMVTPAPTMTTSGALYAVTGYDMPATTANPPYNPTGYAGSAWTVPHGVPVKGWFWSFFFYLTALPAPGNYFCLLSSVELNPPFTDPLTSYVMFLYDSKGHLGVQVTDGWVDCPATTAWTQESYSPHRIWWLNFSMGGSGLTVDSIKYTPGNSAIHNIGSTMTTSLQDKFMGIYLLSDNVAAHTAPPGSWISKIQVGINNVGGVGVSPYPVVVDPPNADAVAAAYAANVPKSDSQLVSQSAVTYGQSQYLCGDVPLGSSTLTDSWGVLSGSPTAVGSGVTVATGPY